MKTLKMNFKAKNSTLIMALSALLSSQASIADVSNSYFSRFSPKQATLVFQGGAFTTTQGNAQQVNIKGLIGDRFTLSDNHAQNIMFGLGYYINGLTQDRFSVLFGINAYYLPHTTVQGYVVQEKLFQNLSYHYSLSNYPVYLAAKGLINTNSSEHTITVDLGVGPNFIRAYDFAEGSLDGGVTIPDSAFSSQTNVALSATVGVGIKFNHFFGNTPCELGYRFFYLGQGNLNTINNQITSTLYTGNNYASAIILSIYA